MKRESIVLGVAAWTASVTAFAQTPLGTVFTYQGQLKESGSPASGLYDIRFQLYLASSGGTRYVAIAMHSNEAAKRQHEEMGFELGWGTALDQLVALAKTW